MSVERDEEQFNNRDSDSEDEYSKMCQDPDCTTEVLPGYEYCKGCLRPCESCKKLFGEAYKYVYISNKDQPFKMKVCPQCYPCKYCGELYTEVCRCVALSKFCRED